MSLRYSGPRRVRSSRKRSRVGGVSFVKPSFKNFSIPAIKNYFKYLFTTKEGLKKVGIVAGIFALLVIGLFGWFAKDLPTPNKINSRFSAQTTQIFDRNGKLLYEMHGDKNRILAEWEEIPQDVKDATVAIEDKNFYRHSGFSVMGLSRAFSGVVTLDKSKGGGSTITQQFVKNALLSPERSMARKIKELILSIEIEAMYKKDDILKMYLNEIPYGSNAYGVKVAAKTYFDKELKDLTLEEAAVLAALPQAPTYYSPYGSHKEDLMSRKNLVLDLMAAQGYITKEEAETAKTKEIVFSNNPYGNITAPHFVMYVREQLVEKYGEKMASEGGLRVYTTLDLDKQKAAEAAIEKYADKNQKNYNASNAALVSVDPKTGQVLAMVGSRDFFNQDIDGSVNVATMARQPGSSFKPFGYATAWKKDAWGPGSTIYDFKTDFGGGYIPSNYDGRDHGVQSMRTSLAGSLNIPAVKSLYLAGIDETLETAHEMGITDLNDRASYGLSLVLGAGEVKPIDMATAYGVFGNNGVKQDQTWFVKITDSDGKTIEEYKQKPGKQAIDPQIAYLMSNVLSDNNARSYIFGSKNYLTLPDRPVGTKTGTTNDNKDAWTVGFTPQISTAVWVGNNRGAVMKKGADGSIVAAPIWQEYMKAATAGMPKEEFKKPSGIKTITLDAITGRKVTTSTKQTRTDIFPSWYKVQDVFGQSQEVKVDKLTGKLATANCPDELVETRTYSPITAEISPKDPAYSRWVAPILAWAASQGLSTDSGGLPTESCDLHTGTDKPSIEIQNPSNNQKVNKPFTIRATVSTPAGFKSVIFNIGGKDYTATANGQYYEATVSDIVAGDYTLTATVKDEKFQSAKDSIAIEVN